MKLSYIHIMNILSSFPFQLILLFFIYYRLIKWHAHDAISFCKRIEMNNANRVNKYKIIKKKTNNKRREEITGGNEKSFGNTKIYIQPINSAK